MKTNFLFSTIVLLLFVSCTQKEIIADFDYEISQPFKVRFHNRSMNAYSYKWNFGDGNYSNSKNPEHKYSGKGVYEVTLFAFGENGQQKTSYNITIEDPTHCDISKIVLNKIPINNQYYKFVCLGSGVKKVWETDWVLISSANIPYTFNINESIWLSLDELHFCLYKSDNKNFDGELVSKALLNISTLHSNFWEAAGNNQFNVYFNWY